MTEDKLLVLQQEIDLCREKLNRMLINDPEIVKVSRQLDVLLNEYIKLKNISRLIESQLAEFAGRSIPALPSGERFIGVDCI